MPSPYIYPSIFEYRSIIYIILGCKATSGFFQFFPITFFIFFLSFNKIFQRFRKVKPLVVMVNREHLNSRWWNKPQMHRLSSILNPRRQNNKVKHSCVSFTKTHAAFLTLSEWDSGSMAVTYNKRHYKWDDTIILLSLPFFCFDAFCWTATLHMVFLISVSVQALSWPAVVTWKNALRQCSNQPRVSWLPVSGAKESC